eukprot:CAMPEP_0171460346 /NCGR_PEP_ID=MMETSP0945-20130129/5255_1 /TAXON_ID=109269 /ORGANISM="Vaucheria litorea, Strain CCMP2940" /LENGTH=223 /DNA_ID=CAMNT_0011986523 /DNA_START=152 /DNA_END=823 /DNA_ORIENTATION=-
MRKSAALLSHAIEAEEECITNRMMKRLNELKKEKENLVVEVEREEEHMTNTLQRKLTKVRQEKVDLENQLEREQEYLVNKLQKQLSQVIAEKERLALEVEREEEYLTNTLGKRLEQLQLEITVITNKLKHEKNHVSAPLRKALDDNKILCNELVATSLQEIIKITEKLHKLELNDADKKEFLDQIDSLCHKIDTFSSDLKYAEVSLQKQLLSDQNKQSSAFRT